jgi:hypothetical protein
MGTPRPCLSAADEAPGGRPDAGDAFADLEPLLRSAADEAGVRTWRPKHGLGGGKATGGGGKLLCVGAQVTARYSVGKRENRGTLVTGLACGRGRVYVGRTGCVCVTRGGFAGRVSWPWGLGSDPEKCISPVQNEIPCGRAASEILRCCSDRGVRMLPLERRILDRTEPSGANEHS